MRLLAPRVAMHPHLLHVHILRATNLLSAHRYLGRLNAFVSVRFNGNVLVR
jgi:hypothetical protein